MFSLTSSPLTVVTGPPKEDLKEGPKPSRRHRNPEGLGRWVCLTGQPPPVTGCVKGGVTQRLRATPSSRTWPRSLAPTHCSYPLAGSPAPPWVARSPVDFLVATPWWPPDRCAAGLDFSCGAQRLGKAATLVSSRWSFACRHRRGHVS